MWVFEYSTIQRCGHIETLESMLAENQKNVRRGVNPGFVPLGFFKKHEEAVDFSKRWRSREEVIAALRMV